MRIGTLTWSSLAGRVITGKCANSIPASCRAELTGFSWLKEHITSEAGRRQQAKLKELQIISDRIGCTLAQLSIAWCLRYDSNSGVLLGATSAEQLYENLKLISFINKLTPSVLEKIDVVLGNKPA